MKPFLLAPVLAGALAGAAHAQLDVGADAPDLAPTEWIHHVPVAIDSLEGRVVTYAFLRLEDDDCLFWLERWDALRDRFALDPATFLAVTNESPNYVRETCDTENIRTPILIDPSDQGAKDFDVQLYPAVFVVGAAGTITFAGQPGNDQEIADTILDQLVAARPYPDLGKKQRAITRLLDKRQLKKAAAAIDKALARAKEDDPYRRRLEDTLVLIAAQTDHLTRVAEEAIAEEDWPRAVTALSRLAEEHAGLDGAETAAARIDELRAKEELGREIAAAIEFAKGNRYERDQNWRAAHKTYDSLAKVHADTKAGQRAAEIAVFLKARAKR